MFDFKELDETTRASMLREFEVEQSSNPYRSRVMSSYGRRRFPDLMREAIECRDEDWLVNQIARPAYWINSKSYRSQAERLAYSEFNTWYVRGLCKRLMDEGETHVEVYRAAAAKEPRKECKRHEGKQYNVANIYRGHRAGYHNKNVPPDAVSIPAGPNCHHSVRRCQ